MNCTNIFNIPTHVFGIITNYLGLRDLHMLSLSNAIIRKTCLKNLKLQLLLVAIVNPNKSQINKLLKHIVSRAVDMSKYIEKRSVIIEGCDVSVNIRKSRIAVRNKAYSIILKNLYDVLTKSYKPKYTYPFLVYMNKINTQDTTQDLNRLMIFRYSQKLCHILKYVPPSTMIPELIYHRRFDLIASITYSMNFDIPLYYTKTIINNIRRPVPIFKTLLQIAIKTANVAYVCIIIDQYPALRKYYMRQLVYFGAEQLILELGAKDRLYPLRKIYLAGYTPLIHLIKCDTIKITSYTNMFILKLSDQIKVLIQNNLIDILYNLVYKYNFNRISTEYQKYILKLVEQTPYSWKTTGKFALAYFQYSTCRELLCKNMSVIDIFKKNYNKSCNFIVNHSMSMLLTYFKPEQIKSISIDDMDTVTMSFELYLMMFKLGMRSNYSYNTYVCDLCDFHIFEDEICESEKHSPF